MEFSINGHKVVGSGSEHLINSGLGTGFSGWIRYVVVNGVCIVTLGITSSSTGTQKTIYASMPKSKSYGITTTPDNSNTIWINPNGTSLIGNFNTTTTQIFQLNYAVADDWHE